MDWDIILAWLAANILPLLVSGALGALLYGATWAQAAGARRLRKYADSLTPEQHDLIEKFIAKAQENFANLTGPERMEKVLSWMQMRGIPVNRVYVQAMYNFLRARWAIQESA